SKPSMPGMQRVSWKRTGRSVGWPLSFHPQEKSMSRKASKSKAQAATVPGIDIGISAKDREKIADGLARLLADTYSLYLKTHNFHWNVEGPMFNTLHLMFMGQYTELWNAL